MGYDQTRFSHEINEEFICTICTLVLENPIQTPCEHSFCNECIKGWLTIDKTCPVDRRPLVTNDLIVPSRVLRNLLNNLDIACDFRETALLYFYRTELPHQTYLIFRTKWMRSDYQTGKSWKSRQQV